MNMTVGPHPPAVYWRRRVLVAAPLLVILGTFTTCLAGGSDGSPEKPQAKTAARSSSEPSPTPTIVAPLVPTVPPSPSPSVSQSPPAKSLAPCADKDLTLVALMDKSTYKVGTRPRFKLAVTNSSKVACTRDVGSGQQELSVGVDDKKLWSSDHCSPNKGADERTLYPDEKRTYWLDWSGRTSEAGCPKTRADVGPGTYELVARLGTLVSEPVVFTLTR
jgi:hypothetical protein